MAIQNRRGNYADFDPQKMVAGEWAVVQSGDPNSTRGKAVYMAFNVGDIERMATYEDMQENIVSATSDVQAQFASELTQTINDANSAVDDMQTSIDNKIQSASDTVATLTTNTNTAINSANTAAATANTAADRANDAVEAIQAIIDSDSVVLSWNGRTGQVTPQAGDYTSAQITHGSGTVSSALTFDSAPTAGSQRAVQSGGVYSVLGNEAMGTTATTIKGAVQELNNKIGSTTMGTTATTVTGAIAELVTKRSNNLVAGYGRSGALSNDYAIVPVTSEYVLGTSFEKVNNGGYRATRAGILLVSAYCYAAGFNAGDVIGLDIGRYNSGWVWTSPTIFMPAGTTDRTCTIANFPVQVSAGDIIYLRARNASGARGSVAASELVIEYI